MSSVHISHACMLADPPGLTQQHVATCGAVGDHALLPGKDAKTVVGASSTSETGSATATD